MLVNPTFQFTGNDVIDAAITEAISVAGVLLARLYRLWGELSENYQTVYSLILAALAVYVAIQTLVSMVRSFIGWTKFVVKGALLAYGVSLLVSWYTGESVDEVPVMQEARKIVYQGILTARMMYDLLVRAWEIRQVE